MSMFSKAYKKAKENKNLGKAVGIAATPFMPSLALADIAGSKWGIKGLDNPFFKGAAQGTRIGLGVAGLAGLGAIGAGALGGGIAGAGAAGAGGTAGVGGTGLTAGTTGGGGGMAGLFSGGGALSGLISGGLGIAGDIYGAEKEAALAKKQMELGRELTEKEIAETAREFDASHALQKEQVANQAQQFGQTFGEAQKMNELRRQAYEGLLGAGKSQMAGGEDQFLRDTAAGTPEDIKQMQRDIEAGTAEDVQRGASEMASSMASQGVRGGQAATQLRRGVSDLRVKSLRDVNTMAAEEEARKRALRGAYQQNKALAGQRATLTPATY